MRTGVHLLLLIIVFPGSWTILGTYEAFNEDSLEEDVYQSMSQKVQDSPDEYKFHIFLSSEKMW